MRDLDTPRHHTLDPDVTAGLAADWPRWPVDAQPRAFDRDASLSLAWKINRCFWEHEGEFEEALPRRDGVLGREEAAFWFSLLSHSDFRDPKIADESWLRERSAKLGPAPTDQRVLSLLRTAGVFMVPEFITRYMMRALRALVPWLSAYETLLGMTDASRSSNILKFIDYCPEDQLEEALELARRDVADPPTMTSRVDRVFFALHAGLPTREVIEKALEEAPRQRSFYDQGCFMLCLHAEDAQVDALIREREFIWHPDHVLLYVARRGLGDLDVFLDQVMTLRRSYPERPEPETLAMFEHIKAPEVIARLQPHMERGGEVGEIAQRIIDAAVPEHAAHGLLECCKRAGKKRTWAIGQLRRLLDVEGGREAIEGALTTKKGKMVAFVRAEVLDHEDDVARFSLEGAPVWAKALIGEAEGLEEPHWLRAEQLPSAVDARSGLALPVECVEALVRLDARVPPEEELVGAAIEHLTGESRTDLSDALMRQWMHATSLSAGGSYGYALEYARSLEWVARHPSPAGVAMLEEYIRSSKLPNRRRDPDRMIHRAMEVLCEVGSPEALSATLRIELKGRSKATRSQATDALGATQDALGITRDELCDLATPTFGLDTLGGRDFDYGARSIRMKVEAGELVFEDLKRGKKTSVAPKGLKSDDVDLVVAAREVFDVTVKPLRVELGRQRARMEAAMMRRRRWSASWWRERVATHPLLGPLARGLVWEVWRGDERLTMARLTEEGDLIDLECDDVDLQVDDALALAHPALFGEDIMAWTKHMLEFEIVQPFDQLSRHASDPDEARAFLERALAGKPLVDLKALKALCRDGPLSLKPATSWSRNQLGVPAPVGGSLTMSFTHAPAPAGALTLEEMRGFFGAVDLDELDPVTSSECVRALTLAASHE